MRLLRKLLLLSLFVSTTCLATGTSKQIDKIHATGGADITVGTAGGNVVVDSAAQTLTNKLINCANNTCSNMPAGSPTTYKEVPSGSINGSNTSFTLAHTPSQPNSLVLTEDGLGEFLTTDYTISGATITMIVAPASGQSLQAIYY